MTARVIAETVPSQYVHLRRLPLTLNGKVNIEALPEAGEEGGGRKVRGYEGPRTEGEEKLAGIWREVLGRERVGIHENFFELGGDSILSIQIIARANRAGMGLMPKQLFQHPTIAELAAVGGAERRGEGEAGKGEGEWEGEQGEVEGEAALTPIQRWFFEMGLERPGHYNQSL